MPIGTDKNKTGRIQNGFQAFHKAVLENLSDGIALLGEKHDVIYCNPAYYSITGYTESEVDKCFGPEWIHPEDHKRTMAAFEEIFSNPGAITTIEYRLRRKNGKWIWLETAVSNMMKIPEVDAVVFRSRDITVRKKAELQYSRMRNILLESQRIAQVGSFEYVAATEETVWSDEEFRIYGLDPEKGSPDYEEMLANSIHPDDAELLDTTFKEAFANSAIYELTHKIIHPDGTVRIVHDVAHPYFDDDGNLYKYIGVTLDVTDRYKAEAELKKSRKKYQDMYNNAPDMYASVDAETALILECNQTLVHNTGYHKDEIIGRPIFHMYHPDSFEASQKAFQSFFTTGRVHNAELQLKKKDGSKIDVILNVSPILNEEGHIIATSSAWRDISEYKRMEKEKDRLETQLQQAHKLESIGTLAGGIAHDFNNILASIIGYTELSLAEVQKGSALEDNLNEVYVAGKRAKDLVQQILAFARQSDEKRSPLRPSSVAKEVLKFIRSTTPSSIEIRHKIQSNGRILGSKIHIHQVLMNLCTNAAHAMEESGGILEVNMKDIFLDKEDAVIGLGKGDYVQIEVKDTGVGIDQKTKLLIFEPYFTTKKFGEGTGMGLSVAHGIVESYGGKIIVNSQLGKGATFTVYLPITKERTPPERFVDEKLPTGTEHILLVDDEASIVKVCSLILKSLGYLVTSQTSSIDALALFRSKPDDFDLVITDMTMPNMTGDNLAIELMKIRPDIPVILCTGYSKKISEETILNIGIKALKYKPLVKAELAQAVRSALDNDRNGHSE